MRTHQVLLSFLIGLLIASCSDSGSSDSSPTGTSPKFYDVTVSLSPSEGGTISPSADSSYEEGSQISLQANPTNDYTFSGWSGTVDTSANPFTITVDKDYNLTANFHIKSYELTVNTSGDGSVTEQVVQQKTDYEHGTVVELTADPDAGWEFNSWDGDTVSTNNPLTVSVDSAITVTAIFTNPTFDGGNGTQEYPYQISTVDQLQAVSDYPSSHFIQINDIDASTTSTWNGGAGFDPLGDSIIHFNGSYNGNGYTISNLKINRREDYIGLFGYIENASVINLTLNQVDVFGSLYTAGLVGQNIGGELRNVSVTGVVIGGNYTGAIVGRHIDGVLINAQSDCSIEGKNNVGGLLGQNRGQVFDSISLGSISSSNYLVGGLTGQNSGIIVSSFSSVNVSGLNEVGGFVGQNRGEITESYSSGDVIANISGYGVSIGGFSGKNELSATISNSYSIGAIIGIEEVGGFVGTNSSSEITKSFSTGSVEGNQDVGGFIGINGGVSTSCYWDFESSNQPIGVGTGNNSGTTGLTTSEMTGTSAETNMSAFDFVNIWVTTSSYPALFWE